MFFLNKLIDNSRRKFPDVQILSFSYDDCKTLKLGAKVSIVSRRVLTCSVSFLCSAAWLAESYKNRSWLIGPIVPLISSSENTVKFSNAFFRLGFLDSFSVSWKRYFYLASWMPWHRQKQRRHIQKPLQDKQFQPFFPDKSSRNKFPCCSCNWSRHSDLSRRERLVVVQKYNLPHNPHNRAVGKSSLLSCFAWTELVFSQLLYPRKSLFLDNSNNSGLGVRKIRRFSESFFSLRDLG